MKFSLVVATLGRFVELDILLQSFVEQKYKNFEVIIIDQNTQIDLQPLVQKYSQKLNLIYMHSDIKGLSVNRNKGLAVASGEIVCFPDDDCHYFPDTLELVNKEFEYNDELYFLLGKLGDFSDKEYQESDTKKKILINTLNFLVPSISPAIFYRVNQNAKFFCDKTLGIGAEFGSGEDTDFVLYYLSLNLKGKFYPHIYIHHPSKHQKPDVAHIEKYASGFGAVMKKGVKNYRIYTCYLIFLRYMLSAFIKCFIPNKNKIGWTYLKSYLRGFIEYA